MNRLAIVLIILAIIILAISILIFFLSRRGIGVGSTVYYSYSTTSVGLCTAKDAPSQIYAKGVVSSLNQDQATVTWMTLNNPTPQNDTNICTFHRSGNSDLWVSQWLGNPPQSNPTYNPDLKITVPITSLSLTAPTGSGLT